MKFRSAFLIGAIAMVGTANADETGVGNGIDSITPPEAMETESTNDAFLDQLLEWFNLDEK